MTLSRARTISRAGIFVDGSGWLQYGLPPYLARGKGADFPCYDLRLPVVAGASFAYYLRALRAAAIT